MNKAMEYGLIMFAFFVLFAKLNHWVEYLFITLLGIWFVRQVSLRKFNFVRTPVDLPLLLLLGWILATLLTATDPAYSFAEWRKTLAKVLMLYFVVNVIEGETQVRRIVLAFVSGAFVLSLIGAIRFFSGGGELLNMCMREGSLTGAGQWFSSYLIMSLPFLWLGITTESGLRSRWLYGIASCFALVALFLTHTRGAWIALLIQVIVLASLRFTRSGLVAAGIAVVPVACLFALIAIPGQLRELLMETPVTATSSMLIRFKTWSFAVTEIVAHPLAGLGYGKHSFGLAHPEIAEQGYHSNIHNSFVSMAYQVGIPGFLLFGWVFVKIIRVSYQSWRCMPDQYSGQLALAVLLMTVGVIVRNLFDDMFIGTLVYLFWLLSGLKFALDKSSPMPAAR